MFFSLVPSCTLSVSNPNMRENHWSFLRTFRVCTVNIIRHDNLSDLTDNLLNYSLQNNFVHLQNIFHFPGESNISINISLGNKSMLNLRLFLSKYRPVCNIEILLTVLVDNADQTIDNLEFNFQYTKIRDEICDKSNPLDFILIPFTAKVLNLRYIYSIQYIFTRAAVILINVNSEEIYFPNVAEGSVIEINYASTRNKLYELFFVGIPLYKIPKKSMNRYQFRPSNFKLSSNCPVESKRLRTSIEKLRFPSWSHCVNDLIFERLNCTSRICYNSLNYMFKSKLSTDINKFSLISSHGGGVLGVQYSLFYNAENARNIYALISPFSLTSWIIIIIISYMVALLLFIFQINFKPFFWMFTILLEQNCTKSSKITNADVFIVFVWLFGAFLLRNAYTSNLYTLLSVELEPLDLPTSFQEILNSWNVKLLVSFYASSVIKKHKNEIAYNSYGNNFAGLTIKEQWKFRFNPATGKLSNIRSNSDGVQYLCKAKRNGYVDVPSCVKLDLFGYVITKSSGDYYSDYANDFGKLLLLTSNFGLKLSISKEIGSYQSRLVDVFESDSIFKTKFEKYMAALEQSGIDLLQKKYLGEADIKYYVNHLRNEYGLKHTSKQSISVEKLAYYSTLWFQNGCFTVYSKEKCDINTNSGDELEIPVKFIDLLVVWMLCTGLYITTVINYRCEA